MQTTILCYGDSNTWGYDPVNGSRFPRDVRWTGVLQRILGDQYLIIEEGLSGRTTAFDDPIFEFRNGKDYLVPCLYSHAPLDLVIIMLGTNDVQPRFQRSAADIATAAGALVGIALRSGAGPVRGAPRVLLIAPPPLGQIPDAVRDSLEGGEEKARRFAQHYRRIAADWGCEFLDAGEVIVSSDRDGIHFEADEHKKLGVAVAERVRGMFG